MRIVVTSVIPKENGSFLVRLYNPEASVQQTDFLWKGLKPSQVVILKTGKSLTGNVNLEMAGMGVMEIRISQQ